jgi:hypothetical protein
MADENEEVDRGDNLVDEVESKADAAPTDAEKEVVEDVKASAEDDEKASSDDKKNADELMLPKRRYDQKSRQLEEERRKRAELEKRLEELEKKDEDKPLTAEDLNSHLRALDKQVEEARAEGDIDKVVDLMNQQRDLNNKFFMSALDTKTSEATATAKNATALDLKVAELENAYDILNSESESFDQDLVNEINELQEALELKGYPPADALTRAVELLVPSDASNKVVDINSKKKTDVKKNVDTASKQPTDIEDVGENSDSSGIQGELGTEKLSEEEFDAIPESKLRQMRGDFL